MKTKQTPGEWKIKLSKKGKYYKISADDWAYFCYVYAHASGSCKEEAEANAKLIAAAPDLLEALIEIKEYIDKMGVVSIAMQTIKNKAKEAIKKATE